LAMKHEAAIGEPSDVGSSISRLRYRGGPVLNVDFSGHAYRYRFEIAVQQADVKTCRRTSQRNNRSVRVQICQRLHEVKAAGPGIAHDHASPVHHGWPERFPHPDNIQATFVGENEPDCSQRPWKFTRNPLQVKEIEKHDSDRMIAKQRR
jgi:hypothetical protein